MRSFNLAMTVGLLLAASAFTAAPAAAQDQDSVSLTIEVEETDCEDHTWCFVVTEGDLADITPGANVTITFKNTGNSPHQLDVSTLDDADPDRQNTPPDVRIANTTSGMAGGEEETIDFTAPEDAEGLYFWCGVSGHEGLGMWIEAPYGTTDGDGDGGAGDDEDDDAGEASAPGALILMGVLALAFVALRRRD